MAGDEHIVLLYVGVHAKLPEHLQEVVILKEYTELNYKEIGRVLGITEGNVKVRIFRAREQLIKLIGEENVFLPE